MARRDDDDDNDRPALRRRRYDDEDDDRDDERGRGRYRDEEGEYDFRRPDPPHSGPGIASCVLAVLAVLAAGFALVLWGISDFGDLEQAVDAEDPAAVLAVLLVLGTAFLCLLGGVLGGIGLAQCERKKIFAIIGLSLNVALFLGGLGLMVIGLVAE
jgi:hypothetical protein